MEESIKLIAKTLYGLESVLASELRSLGAEDIRLGRRMVSFSGNKKLLYLANIRLRTALRVLKPIFTFKAEDADELYQNLLSFDWSSVLDPSQTFAIDPVVYSETFRHSRYVGYRTKDAVADYFKEQCGNRPSVRLVNPDILINVHISRNDVTISLDSSGESLHKRGYRLAQTEAPLNEVLAAGILLKAGWKGETDLIDPMCGSGTFLIEAALIACNISPGIYRPGFGFERWTDFDKDLYETLIHDNSEERLFTHKIYGSDISSEAIAIAHRNVERAALSKHIQLSVSPLQAASPPETSALIITNPPYGQRLSSGENDELFDMIGNTLKHTFAGSRAFILAHRPEQFARIGLKPMLKEQLMNGALDCELRGYQLFSGTFSEYRQQELTEDSEETKNGRAERTNKPRQFNRDDRPRQFNRDDRPRQFNRDDKPRQFNRDDKPRQFNRDDKPRQFNRDDKPRQFNRDDKPRQFNRDDRPRQFNRDDRPRQFNRDDKPRQFNRDDKPRQFNRDDKPRQFNRDDRPRQFNRDDRPRQFNRDDRNPFEPEYSPTPAQLDSKRNRNRIGDYRTGKTSQGAQSRYKHNPWPTDRLKPQQIEENMLRSSSKASRFNTKTQRERNERRGIPSSTNNIQIIRNNETER